MTIKTTALLSGLFLLMTAKSAIAHEICDPFRSPRLQPQLANCESLVRRNLVPNKAALRYSIKYLVANQKGFQDSSCVINGMRYGDRCTNCQGRDWIEKGIENNCSFILNDLQQPWDKKLNGPHNRTTGYFVDLCASERSGLVSKFYINGGRGKPGDDIPRENLSFAPSNSSILAGAFMLNGEVSRDFVTSRPAAYAGISARHGGIPGIRMVGLNSSNNTTEFDKPLHVSAFKTGLGCPGVAETTVPIMNNAVSRGTSLYMSYAGQKFEQKGNSCVNDSSDYNQGIPRAAERSTASVGSPKHRAVFEFPESVGAARKMQVDLIEKNNLIIAHTKIATSGGEAILMQLVCHKLGTDEYNCRRDDNGGGFDILVSAKPRITIGHFSIDSEESEDLVLKGQPNKLLVVEGKKATISDKDAF